jgi:hypothetical protein
MVPWPGGIALERVDLPALPLCIRELFGCPLRASSREVVYGIVN